MIFLPFERFSATFYMFFSSFCKFKQGKISQIRPKLDIYKRIGQYLLSDSCSNKESDTREFGLSHSCAASQLAVGFRTGNVSPRDTALTDNLLYRAAGLRRDAIAS